MGPLVLEAKQEKIVDKKTQIILIENNTVQVHSL